MSEYPGDARFAAEASQRRNNADTVFTGWPRAGVDHLGVLCDDPACKYCIAVRAAIGRKASAPSLSAGAAKEPNR